MISDSDLLVKELLKALFLGDPRAWRLRQVTQITPLTTESYRARTSYQLRFTRALIRQVWSDAFLDVQDAPAAPDGEIEVIVPIDYLPKYVLLDFSLEDSAGKPLVLLASSDITAISFEIVHVAMTVLDERCADGARRAQDFFEANRAVLLALVATGQREIPARLERLRAFPTLDPSEYDYCRWMLAFLSEGLEQFSGRRDLEPAVRDLCWTRLQEIYREIDRAGFDLKGIISGSEGYRDPLLNPGLLVVDYLKTNPEIAVGALADTVDAFLVACRGFVSTLLQLAYDDMRFVRVVTVLRRMGRYYVAYSRMKVPQDRDFVVKMEQIIPAGSEWSWREPLRAFRYRHFQWYPIRIGDSRSTHVEVSCEHPIELEQVPGSTRVRAERQIARAEMLFGRSSYETKYHQHFYTTKTGEQLERALGVGDVGAQSRVMYDLKLGIKYAVEGTTRWGYRLVTLVVLAALIFLVAIYDPEKMRSGQVSFVPILPVLFALFGALASLRPQESIVALRMKKYKIAVLGMGLVMAAYFLCGLVWPASVTTMRSLLRWTGLGSFLL